MRRHKSFYALWGMPIVLGVASLIGLIVALLDDGVWDVVGWVGLGVPVLVIGWYVWRPRAAEQNRPLPGLNTWLPATSSASSASASRRTA